MLSFSHEVPWMRSGTELSQFLRVFLPTFKFFSETGTRFWLVQNYL